VNGAEFANDIRVAFRLQRNCKTESRDRLGNLSGEQFERPLATLYEEAQES
jgi:hypothetical protein